MAQKKWNPTTPVESLKHKDKRASNPIGSIQLSATN